MPTTLPSRRRRRPDYVVMLLVALAASFFVIEIVDPAPMDVEASLIAAQP